MINQILVLKRKRLITRSIHSPLKNKKRGPEFGVMDRARNDELGEDPSTCRKISRGRPKIKVKYTYEHACMVRFMLTNYLSTLYNHAWPVSVGSLYHHHYMSFTAYSICHFWFGYHTIKTYILNTETNETPVVV